MSFSRPLSVICERPTADGAVQASHVDKEKLQTWFLNVCGEELAEEIEDEDLICFFCVWHAEFLVKHGIGGEEIRWWPQDLDYLDDAAKELWKNYFDGKVEQCWVQLEQIDVSDSDENKYETGLESVDRAKRKECIYCEKTFCRGNLLVEHVKKAHEKAIRCDKRQCATYFHTAEEKEKHAKEVHDKMFQCGFCVKKIQGNSNYHSHVRNMHAEYSVNCAYYGCLLYFKKEIEMKTHYDSAHKEENEVKIYKCKHCAFRAKTNQILEGHVAAKHLPKTIKCGKCNKWFASTYLLKKHDREEHTFKICSHCQTDVAANYFSYHTKKQKCRRCESKFECAGLLRSHLKICKKPLFECDKCPRSFQKKSLLSYHAKIAHRAKQWRGLQNKKLGFKCQPCKSYFKNPESLKAHLRYKHKERKLKQCAHCPKSFRFLYLLKQHLCEKHNLIKGSLECDFCQRKFATKSILHMHMRALHLIVSASCPVCGKEMLTSSINTHLLRVHDLLSTL